VQGTYAEGQLWNCRCTIDLDWWVWKQDSQSPVQWRWFLNYFQ